MKRGIHATPLAFGEGDTKNRVKNVLHYKKPAFWVVAVSIAAVVAIGIGLTANPKSSASIAKIDNALPEGKRTGTIPSANMVYLGKELKTNTERRVINFRSDYNGMTDP